MILGMLVGLMVAGLFSIPLPWHAGARRTYLAAGLGIFLAMTSVYWSSQFIPSGWISVLFGLAPIVTGLLATFLLAERREHQSRTKGLAFEEVAGVLEAFVHGLNGRRLKIACDEESWTDTETLHLPASVSRFESREENFQLYKAMVVHQWAQTWYGTWRATLPLKVSDIYRRLTT